VTVNVAARILGPSLSAGCEIGDGAVEAMVKVLGYYSAWKLE
jgi:hypothetical protein